MAATLGIDVGGTHIRAAVHDGSTLHRFDTRPVPTTYPALLAQISALREQAQQCAGEVTGIGIGLPGVVTESGGAWIPNLPFLNGEPLATHVQDLAGVQPQMANDAQMALLGELRTGAAGGCSSAALLSLGTGIGGAYAVASKVVRGAANSAGSFGWLGVDADVSGGSEHGPLEHVASGRALERLGAALDPPQSPFELVAAARRGQPQAVAVLDELAVRLGRASASLVSILDPQVLLISGGLSDAFDLLEPGLHAQLLRFGSPSGRRVPIRRAALGDFAGVHGAVYAASQRPDNCFL